jgi:hypothetical protein
MILAHFIGKMKGYLDARCRSRVGSPDALLSDNYHACNGGRDKRNSAEWDALHAGLHRGGC